MCALLLAAIVALTGVAMAQEYEDGRAAYLDGDYARALKIIRPLADGGDAEAQKLLGVMYDYGHGVKADAAAALQWYIKSAEQGDPAVQYQVGTKYFRGEGVAQDQVEAARWWGLAANGGQVDAQFNLGLMYFRGVGVGRDDARAAELFRKAAEQGHGHAQYSLGVMYAFERGMKRDYHQALDWFNKAAAQGVPQAQFNLGVLYENGFGVNADPAMARQWYERAAAQGLTEAGDRLQKMGTVAAQAPTLSHPDEPATAATIAPGEASATPAGAPSTRVYVPEPAAAKPAPDTGPKAAPAADAGPKREDWVRAQKPDSYTLQIGSVTSEKDMRRFLQDAGIEAQSAYIRVEINGTTRYNALYGAWASYAEAAQAAGELPDSLRQVQPWVRNFGVLQQLLK